MKEIRANEGERDKGICGHYFCTCSVGSPESLCLFLAIVQFCEDMAQFMPYVYAIMFYRSTGVSNFSPLNARSMLSAASLDMAFLVLTVALPRCGMITEEKSNS